MHTWSTHSIGRVQGLKDWEGKKQWWCWWQPNNYVVFNEYFEEEEKAIIKQKAEKKLKDQDSNHNQTASTIADDAFRKKKVLYGRRATRLQPTGKTQSLDNQLKTVDGKLFMKTPLNAMNQPSGTWKRSTHTNRLDWQLAVSFCTKKSWPKKTEGTQVTEACRQEESWCCEVIMRKLRREFPTNLLESTCPTPTFCFVRNTLHRINWANLQLKNRSCECKGVKQTAEEVYGTHWTISISKAKMCHGSNTSSLTRVWHVLPPHWEEAPQLQQVGLSWPANWNLIYYGQLIPTISYQFLRSPAELNFGGYIRSGHAITMARSYSKWER